MILVTGATGLIGSHLTLYLIRKGHKVRAVYRNKESISKTQKIFELYESEPQQLFDKIEWVQADITDITSLENIHKNITEVYHSAALVSFDNNKKEELYQTNVDGTANMLHLALENKVKKFLHVSSIASLGTYDKPVTEKTHWNWKEKHSEYAVSKYLSEMEVWRASQEGLPVVIINPSVVLGAGFWNEGTGKLFEMIDKGMRFYPGGSNNFVDVWDVVKAASTLMQSNIINDSFIIGGHHTSYKDLMQLIAHALHKKPPMRKLPYPLILSLSKLDWIKSRITGSYNLSSGMVRTLYQNRKYSSDKLTQAIGHQFIPLKASINNMAGQYQKTMKK